jgi:5'-deoxynucleotidase YfbR-like HD superfamily hydrolase
MKTKEEKIRALRESGELARCHTIPHHGEYSIGKHCYNMACMLMILHPNPPGYLYHAIITHDFPERFTGDLPATVKWAHPGLAEKLDEAEKGVFEHYQLFGNTGLRLTPSEQKWVKALDTIELLLWAEDQIAMGNQNAMQIKRNIQEILPERMKNYPPEVRQYLNDRIGWSREGDYVWPAKQS